MNTIDTSVLWGYVLFILAINILHVYCVKCLDKHILLLILNSYNDNICFVDFCVPNIGN